MVQTDLEHPPAISVQVLPGGIYEGFSAAGIAIPRSGSKRALLTSSPVFLATIGYNAIIPQSPLLQLALLLSRSSVRPSICQ